MTNQSVNKDKMTDDDVSIAIMPLLIKLQEHLKVAFPNLPTAITNDCEDPNNRDEDRYGRSDGACLILTYSDDVTYKFLGSEWHEHDKLAFINIVKVENMYVKAWRGDLLERAEVDGSEDLTAEFLDWYEWAEFIAEELARGDTY